MKLSVKKLEIQMAVSCIDGKNLCKKAGIGRPTLTQIKTGKRNAKPATIGKIAKALGVPVEDLIAED